MAMVDVLVSFTPFWFSCLKGFGFMRELNVKRRMTQIGLSISCVFKAYANKKQSMLYCWSVAKKDGLVDLSNMEISPRGMDGEVYDGM